jgi:pimeloyl-ACP methyl ester carboxylesterase
LNSTSEDFAKDAIAVWKHAKTIPEIDPLRIGMLGHSEGALVGPMAAVWEPGVAFLILLAPPGVTGSQILKSQIDRISELQGMSEADRKATLSLQGKLQDIASSYFTDETKMRRDIQNAIKQNWDSLKSIAQSQDPNVDLDQVRKDLTYQIESQFQQLRMPWFRFFLTYDPTLNWMMMRCPTLAIWGSNDVQVLPELNRAKILRAIGRNQNLEAQLEILPGLNHLLQTSTTGLPEEYEEIEETISPSALRAIRIWAEEQGLIER